MSIPEALALKEMPILLQEEPGGPRDLTWRRYRSPELLFLMRNLTSRNNQKHRVSGKRVHNYGVNHHAIGKTHELSMASFNSI